MKKFKLFLLAAVAVLPVLQSCNDSDVEVPTAWRS